MKARGKNYSRMSKKQKSKIDKTMKRMERVRTKDNIKLRKNIKDKLEWARAEQKKGLEAIEHFKKNIQTNIQELLKLRGIILVLTQLLEESNNKEK